MVIEILLFSIIQELVNRVIPQSIRNSNCTNSKYMNDWGFFCDFSKFFPIEIFHMVCRLRIENFTIIGQGVPEIFLGVSYLPFLGNFDDY